MTNEEAVAKLNQLRSFFVDGGSMTQALDYAIASLESQILNGNQTPAGSYDTVLERPDASGKAIDHSEQVLDMVTPTDSIANTTVESISRSDVDPFDERVAILEESLNLVNSCIFVETKDGKRSLGCNIGGESVNVSKLIYDMQAHIRKLHAEERNSTELVNFQADAFEDVVKRKNALLLEAADEIEAYVNNEYSEGARDNYPTIRNRYKRDMEIVNRIRKESVK